VPYFGYARQDRRGGRRTPVGARVVAELFDAAPLDRLAVIDLHTAAIEGFLAMPVEHLTAVPLLAEAARRYAGPDGVIVAPDLGAAKLADRYARILKLPVAVVHKTRVSGSEVHVTGVAGDVRGRPPIIVDDMLSTGGTIEAAVHALVQAGSLADMTVAITHGLFVGPARERLRALPVGRIIATDSVRRGPDVGLPVETVGIGPLLGEAIRRLHDDESLAPFAGG
jgi:ribose-phosphate pyrophosphokinase